jgi:hypothetical protein
MLAVMPTARTLARLRASSRTLASVAALVAFSAACSSSAPSAPSEPSIAVAVDVRDASVTELVGQLAGALGTPVRVETDAVPLTRCARVTLVAPRGTTRTQVLALAREVLRGAALSLEDEHDHLAIARIADADPPVDCPRIARAQDPLAVPLDPLPPIAVEPATPTDGIRLVSENTYEIDPDAEVFRGWPAAAMTQARVVPQTENGVESGLRFYGIRRSSALAALGLQNGDTVTHLDGQPITGADMALEAYTRHRDFQRITIQLLRRGQPMTLTYVRAPARPTP